MSVVVANDLTGLTSVYAQAVDSLDGAYGMRATRALQGYFIESNGRLQVHAAVLDLAIRQTAASFELEGPLTQGTVPLANALAKKLNARARAFQTANESAFHAFGEALTGGDRSAVLRALKTATGKDPQFSLAYLERAQILAAAGDRAGALAVVEAARQSRADEISGARFDVLAASIRRDWAGQARGLAELARLTPADAAIFEELGRIDLSQRKFSDAARDYDRATRLDEEHAAAWNDLGYARSYAGDLNAAKIALAQYQRLETPDNVNPLDSMGEVSFYLGDFAAAEKYFFDADRKNPREFNGADMLKAAQARLFSGDLQGADVLFQRYAGRENAGGQAAFQKAQWEFLTGRRRDAMAGLERMLPSLQGDSRAIALGQLSVWALQAGDRKAAAQFAAQAGEGGVGPAGRNISALCRAISNPDAGSSGSRLADAYAKLFAGRFEQAAPLLEALYRETDPHNDGEVRTLLAWAYVRTGREREARPLIGTYPIPLSSSETLFTSWVFPRYLFVRGAVLQQEGKRAEAKAAYELFLKYSGDVPDAFSDEANARKNLSAL